MSKVSIITTTYNHQDFISQTIESVLSQTFTDWELLIGDDNSIDNTYIEALKYSLNDSRIKVYKHKINLGLVDNMNFLLGKVDKKSDYIAFLEGDDMFMPNNLNEKIKIFEKYKDVILVDCEHEKINKDSKIIEEKNNSIIQKIKNKKYVKNGLNKMSFLDLLISGNIIQSFGTVMVKKNTLFQNFPFVNLDKNNKMFGPLDYFIWINILPDNYWYHIDKKLFNYRIHNNNFTKNIKIFNNQIELIYNYIIENNNNPKILKICNFYIEHNKMISNFFEGNNFFSLKHGFKSFYYNQTINFFERIGIITLSILPKFIQKKIITIVKINK